MKITLSTIKKFVKENKENLFINKKSSFDGMIDGCRDLYKGFIKTEVVEEEKKEYGRDNTLGVKGAWFVFDSRDYFQEYEDEEFRGFSVYNACGYFILAIKK